MLSLLDPTQIDRLKSFWLQENLRHSHTSGSQFVVREITSASPEIGPGIAQNIDQLKRHAIAFPERKHLVFAQAAKLPNMLEANPRPQSADPAIYQVRLLVQILGALECANFCR